jgi:hypothetical protein
MKIFLSVIISLIVTRAFMRRFRMAITRQPVIILISAMQIFIMKCIAARSRWRFYPAECSAI